MADSVFCKNCGVSITGEEATGDPRTPCPQCGSLTRSFHLQASGGIYNIVGGSATLTVLTYPERLLTVAQDLIANGEFSIAVVVAQMACEISTEIVLSRRRRMTIYNLANKKVRAYYNAATGEQIETRPFWPAFKTAAKLRHATVHHGRIATESEAEAAVEAASALVDHLKQHTR